MCSDCNTIVLLTMSDSELLLVKDKNQECQLDLLNSPTLEFPDNSHVLPVSSSTREQDNDKGEEQEKGKIPSSGRLNATSDDGDDDKEESGFKTPTSLDHKIPVITQCPGAPRKPKFLFSSRKRKASSSSSSSSSLSASSNPPSSNARRSLQLDLSQEVKSLLPMPILADLHRKIKKARRDDSDTQ